MDVVHERVAALDVSKKDAKVCVRVPGARKGTFTREVTTWGSMTGQVLELREFLLDKNVTLVVMEATGDYWKQFYYLLEDALPVQLVNAAHAKNLPGRKSDVNDAQWLAQLAAHGLLRGSLVPPPPVRELRDLTRLRSKLTNDRSKEHQRLEKLLEDAGVKLSVVATDILGVSGRLMLGALCAGTAGPEAMAELAKGRMRSKIPELREALTGRFTSHHAFLTRLHLQVIDGFDAAIAELEARIEVVMEPFRPLIDLLLTMPGIGEKTAQVMVAEAGAVIDCFPSAACFASWAGLAPGSNQSGPKTKPARTRHGNTYLKGALGIAALSVSRSRGTFLSARYHRIATRRGPMRALVATEHSMATAMWHMLTQGVPYLELGGDYYTRREPERAKARITAQAEALGLAVTFSPIEPDTASQ
ncbi:transposase [Streptomyces sp. 846.5]|nr:IS110 family transposase [Streptomyces sp. 846.5]TDU05375.1 transposase [Streptomyces sp. 846.5]